MKILSFALRIPRGLQDMPDQNRCSCAKKAAAA